jgi:hypothetical protein
VILSSFAHAKKRAASKAAFFHFRVKLNRAHAARPR